jgi:branched-chain amino acid transport system substrate-binding protein
MARHGNDGVRLEGARLGRRALVGGTAAALAMPAIAQAQAPVLKVGLLLPKSGYLAQAGQSCHRGAMVAPKVLADFGMRIELIDIDTESSVDLARTQAERAINAGANCIVGPFDSGAALAIAQVCEQRRVPFIINIAAAPQVTEQGYQYLVRNFPTGGQLVTNGLGLIKTMLAATGGAPKSAVFLHANDTFGTAQRGAMDALFPRAGLPFQLLESIAYDPKAQDLSVEVTKIRALNPDILLVVTRAADAIKLVRDMVRQRFTPKGLISPGSPGLYDEEFFQALGPLADYAMYNIPWIDPKAKMTQALAAAYGPANPRHRFAVECFNAGFTFEALLVAGDAFKRAGTTDGEALMKAVRATDIAEHVMVGGPIRFDAKGQNNGIVSACVQNMNRTPTVVLPDSAATAKPVFPMPAWQGRT